MQRRAFIAATGSIAFTWPFTASAQQTGMVRRIGVLSPGPSLPPQVLAALNQGLRELGYTEGGNIVVERVYGDWNRDRFPVLAAELVRRKVDVIVVMSTAAAHAAQQATSTIPIVVDAMADPVGDGLVASLARPGGNITGNTFLGPDLIAKRLGLLKQAMPGLSHVAALWHPGGYGEQTMARMLKETEDAAQVLGVELQLVPAHGPEDFDDVFSAMTTARAGAFIVLPSPMLFIEHRRIVALAAKSRLPAMYHSREFVEAGGFMSYGADINELTRRTATFVGKILKGAKPADIPVEQPTKFDFAINLKTARELGLSVPPLLVALADEVIE